MNPKDLAFPLFNPRKAFDAQIGLTKRECIAAMALQALLTYTGPNNMGGYRYHALHAVTAADDLLKQLDLTQEDQDDTQDASGL